jgi:hypothetical protein
MTDPEATTNEPEIITDEPAPDGAQVTEAKQETALTSVAEQSALDMLSTLDNALAVIERRSEILEKIHTLAIRGTDPADWVLFRDKQGNEFGMITKDGAAKVAPLYGVKVTNLQPIDGRGNWAPERTLKEGKVTLSGSCDCRSDFTNREIMGLSASRSSQEQFSGRTNAEHGGFAGDAVAIADLKSALHTLLTITKPVRALAGLSRVPRAELDAGWAGTDKVSGRCRKGSGYGSGQERRTTDVTDDDIVAARDELGAEIMRRVGGDEVAARKLLKEITAKPGKFSGFDQLGRLSQGWQLKGAWEKLKAHEVFGDSHMGEGDREPGADDEAQP